MNIKYLWVIALAISTMMFIFQVSSDNINPEGSDLYQYEDSFMSKFDSGNGSYELQDNTEEGIPELPASVSSEDNNEFTDIFSSIKNWFTSTKTGAYISFLYTGVPTILKSLGMPPEISFALGFFWNAMAIFSFIVFMRGLL